MEIERERERGMEIQREREREMEGKDSKLISTSFPFLIFLYGIYNGM